MDIPYWFPKDRMMEGGETRRNDPAGITHVHHFYTKRNLWALSLAISKISNMKILILFLASIWTNNKLYRYRWAGGFAGAGGGPLAGTLFIPSIIKDISIPKSLSEYFNKIINRKKLFSKMTKQWLSTNSMTFCNHRDDTIDYIFLDPPFGSNLNYSELNFLWESWLRVITNNKKEAVENEVQKKGKIEYLELMMECFKEAYRVLKPGRWITIEFSNTKAAIWNIIQTTLSDSGFIVANVSALDKKQGSFKAVTTPTAVKQDLVISAYKPNGGFEERFIKEADTEEGVWDFIRTHLGYLPVVKIQNKELFPVDDRQPRILFDHVVAYYVRKGIQIPIASSQAFQAGLKEKFDERDGMYFLHEQALEYDKKKLQTNGLKQSELFVINEESAIQWLKAILSEKPRAIQDIYPDYMQKLTGFDKKEEKLELKTLLEQNFIQDNTGRWHIPDPENSVHVEKIREKALLKEFENYKTASRKLKIFRIEAVRAGFKKAYNDHDYETILKIANKLSGDAIEEDPMLLMWYTSARTRLGED
jgi:hypothetical protein